MLKYLLLMALLIAWLFYSPALRRLLAPHKSAKPPSPVPSSEPAKPQVMVRCAHCGVHLPQSEAIAASPALFYCCAAHQLAGPRRS